MESEPDEFANRILTRAEAVDGWIALALRQSDPGEWVDALAARALDRLNLVPESLTVKAEARRQLLDLRRAIHAGIAIRHTHRPKRL